MSDPMNLFVLTNLFPPQTSGGYELLASDVVSRLRVHGHRVTVVTTGRGEEEVGIARTLHLSRPFGERAARDRFRHGVAAVHNRRAMQLLLHRHGEPDAALVMSMRRLGVEPLRILAEHRVPTVYAVNDDWPLAFVPTRGPGLRGVAGWILDRGPWSRHTWRGVRPDRAVFLTRSVQRLVRHGGAPFPAGRICSQGVDLQAFPRRAFRAITEAPNLLFVGRLHPSKAPDVAIDALVSLVRRGINARVTFAGAPLDTDYERELHALADASGVASRITWLGHVDRSALPSVYSAADVFLYLIRWDGEGQGLTYMEAIASGVPVVAYPMGGAKEFLDDHPIAARADACTGKAVADAIVSMQADVAAQRNLQDGAYDAISIHASLDVYVGTLVEELVSASELSRSQTGSRSGAFRAKCTEMGGRNACR